MNSVINLTEFAGYAKDRRTATLVLVDLHRGTASFPPEFSERETEPALENCRLALAHARSIGLPVAFVRRVDPAASLKQASRYPRWIEGFEPGRSDMVFDRQLPSCYASSEFADMMKHVGGNYVLAGLFGESTCLATAVDAFHRAHKFTYLADASMSRAFDDIDAEAMHRATTKIISLYGSIAETRIWIRASARKVRGL